MYVSWNTKTPGVDRTSKIIWSNHLHWLVYKPVIPAKKSVSWHRNPYRDKGSISPRESIPEVLLGSSCKLSHSATFGKS